MLDEIPWPYGNIDHVEIRRTDTEQTFVLAISLRMMSFSPLSTRNQEPNEVGGYCWSLLLQQQETLRLIDIMSFLGVRPWT